MSKNIKEEAGRPDTQRADAGDRAGEKPEGSDHLGWEPGGALERHDAVCAVSDIWPWETLEDRAQRPFKSG